MRRMFVFLICVIVTLFSLRFLFNTTFFPIHDYTHVTRLVEMDRALRDGHFPVRWVRDLGYGYGEPLFSFYGPAPFYLAEVFHLLGLSFLMSIKAFLIVMTLAGFAGMYLLASKLFGRTGGVLAASAFLLIPYRAVDLFVRGAFNELFAITVVPWILYGMLNMKEKKSWRWTGVVAGLFFLLFTSHNLMTMMFLPFLYVFGVVVLFGVKNKWTYAAKFHIALLLGIAAAAFYLFPSYLEKGFTQVDKLIGGYGLYAYHFLYIRQFFTGVWGYGGSISGIEDGLSFHLGLAHVVLAAVGIAGWFFLKKKRSEKMLAVFIAVAAALALFLTIYKSQFIWDRIPFFVYFQFPWRFLSVTTVFLPLMAGGAVLWIHKKSYRVLAVCVAIIALLFLNLKYFAPSKLLDDPNALYYSDPQRIQDSMSDTLPDYIPIGMKVIQPPFQQPFELLGVSTNDTMQVFVDRTHEKLLSFNLQKPTTLVIRTAWFPGWTVYDFDQKITYTVDTTTDFISVPLQEGQHFISIVFENTPVRAVSNLISILGLLGIAGALFYGRHD
ncbi:MAG: hypothetical protein A2804_02985 [Candidatus Pacebacteria bacterium RIFCSPHIGHO2_01_FULL_46_10]|nr:MAG: hypothetical protein A2804_02985 [Candidatus Pacebacteria bacterium RIFCSPHIGHO2_01_FULL_46_10]